jgi:putative ABC transport system permease protein
MRFGLRIEGGPEPIGGRSDRVYVRWATAGYFHAIGIPVLRGRAFSDADRAGSTPVAIVDQTLARRHFRGGNPIGRRIRASNDPTWREIIGVVGAVRQARVEEAPEPHLYVVPAQRPTTSLTFVVRTAGDPAALLPAFRDRIRRLDPDLPVFNTRTLQDVVRGSVAARRFNATVLALFAVLAAALTSVGIYGVMAYWVGESTHEIGVRVALGASRGEILAMVLGRSLRVTAAGIAAGLGLALAAGQALAGLLFGVRATDPATFAAVTVFVLGVAGAASYVPARRALAIDAATSLKAD